MKGILRRALNSQSTRCHQRAFGLLGRQGQNRLVSRNLSVVSFDKTHARISLPINSKIIEKDISAIWLRWNCTCEKCLQASSGQKILNPLEWPEELILNSCTVENNKLKFTIYGEDDHVGEIPLDLLRQFYQNEQQRDNGSTKMTFHNYPNEWLPEIEFDVIQTPKGQHSLTKLISVNGYAIVKNCPTAKDSVLKVANTITPPTWSFYGLTFDVISQEQAINVAYTNVNLPYHMDLIYMESAPGLQYLLCRKNDKSVVGGTSILVDTFAVAEELKETGLHEDFLRHFSHQL